MAKLAAELSARRALMTLLAACSAPGFSGKVAVGEYIFPSPLNYTHTYFIIIIIIIIGKFILLLLTDLSVDTLSKLNKKLITR